MPATMSRVRLAGASSGDEATGSDGAAAACPRLRRLLSRGIGWALALRRGVGRHRLQLPLRALPEKPARVVEEDVRRLGFAVPAAEEFEARVGQHAWRALA